MSFLQCARAVLSAATVTVRRPRTLADSSEQYTLCSTNVRAAVSRISIFLDRRVDSQSLTTARRCCLSLRSVTPAAACSTVPLTHPLSLLSGHSHFTSTHLHACCSPRRSIPAASVIIKPASSTSSAHPHVQQLGACLAARSGVSPLANLRLSSSPLLPLSFLPPSHNVLFRQADPYCHRERRQVQTEEVSTGMQAIVPSRANGQTVHRSSTHQQDRMDIRRAVHRMRYMRQGDFSHRQRNPHPSAALLLACC